MGMLYLKTKLDMTAEIFIHGVIGQDTDLLSVMHQFKSYSNPTAVTVHINSVGGDVKEGKAIYSYLKALEIPVKTVAQMAFSIAAHIFMSGSERVVEAGADRLMLHMPWAQMSGRSDDFNKVAKELKQIEDSFVDFYSTYLNTDENAIRTLLENETFISGDEAYNLGLATALEIPLKAVAYYNKETNKNTIMQNAEKLINALKSFVGVNTEEGADIVALIVQDANGVEINFPDVAEDAEIAVGDVGQIDGVPATGEVVMPDGSTIVFGENGEVSEIKPADAAEEGEEGVDADAEANVEANADAVEDEDFTKLLESLFAKAKDSLKAEMTAEIQGLQKVNEDLNLEVVALKKLIGSEDIETETKTKKRPSNFLA